MTMNSNKKTIAVTGVGGGVGQSILKSLKNSGYRIICMDADSLAVGLFAAEQAYLIPYASDVNFISRVLEICVEESVDLLFPGMDAELMVFATNVDRFINIGTKVVVSSPQVVAISDNKQLLYDRLHKLGINVPFTASVDDYFIHNGSFPLIIKQKVGGARSKNVFLVKNEEEWGSLFKKIHSDKSNYIAMEYVEGDEYTCGSVNLNNECYGVIVMRRILRDGDTHKCFVELNHIVESEVLRVLDAIKPFGACNVQIRVKGNVPYVFEINARCSGTTAARTLSGFNEPLMIADFLLFDIHPEYLIKEQTILRYWNEIVIENYKIDKIKTEFQLKESSPAQL